ncbi:MAG: hypothetical protein U0R18_08460 [Mycobacterium sp.]
MDQEEADNAAAEREVDNMIDSVILTRALAKLAEVEVWRHVSRSGVGDDIHERERVEALAELTVSLCRYGTQVGRMLDCGVLLQDIAELTDVDVDELRLAASYAP